MTALIGMILLTLWTFLAVRLLCGRATVSDRTMLSYFGLGILHGTITLPLLALLFASDDRKPGLCFWFISSLLAHGILVAPVIKAFLRHRAAIAASVLDAFLLAFLVGFGADLACIFLSGQVADAWKAIGILPPWRFSRGLFSLAGAAYRVGLIAITAIAATRFLKSRKAAIAISVAVWACVSLDAVAWRWPDASFIKQRFFGDFMRSGSLTAWASLVAVAFLDWRERRWCAAEERPTVIKQWKDLLSLAVRGSWRDYAQSYESYARERRKQIAEAEARTHPDDRLRHRAAHALRIVTKPADESRVPWSARLFTAAVWVLLLSLAVVVPELWPKRTETVWNFWPLRVKWNIIPTLSADPTRPDLYPYAVDAVNGQITLLELALVMTVAWRILRGVRTPANPADPDDVIRLQAVRQILNIALLSVVLVMIYRSVESLLPYAGFVGPFLGEKVRHYPEHQASTLILLFAAAVSSWSFYPIGSEGLRPLRDCRKALIRNAFSMVSMFTLAWLALIICRPIVFYLHGHYGARLFAIAGKLGTNANNLTPVIATVVMTLAATAVGYAFSRLTARAEAFLLDTPASRSAPPTETTFGVRPSIVAGPGELQ